MKSQTREAGSHRKVAAQAATPSPAPHIVSASPDTIRHHSQEVRQGSAKSSPPVQVWVMPPKKYLANSEIFFYEINPQADL